MGSFCSTPKPPEEEQVVETIVCKVSDLDEGAPKQFKLDGDKPCLVVKHRGQIHAVSDKCTHYGASLSNGAFNNGVVRCPWHGACFNVETGDIEDFPGLDSLHKFQVEVNSGEVKVRARKSQLENTKMVRSMVKRSADSQEAVVIIGGGAAAETCAETLRQNGYDGKLTMLTMEESPPYERIKLSKALTSTAESLRLRPQQFYDDAEIEVRTSSQVVNINPDQKEVELSDGQMIGFTKLVIASGCMAKKLDCPGADLKNVFALRTPTDANSIAATAGQDKDVVVLGTSFIAMEIAAYFVNKAKGVTVVGRSLPFERSLGVEIGRYFKQLFEKKGVQFKLGTSISEIKESPSSAGQIGSVSLGDGSEVTADVLVCGIGVEPNTGFLKKCNLNLSDGGYVTVDEFMGTNVPNIWAAGDVVSFPLFLAEGAQVSIGHWQLAQALGRNAALNLLGKREAVRSVPFFWTVLFGMSFRYAGHAAHGFDDILYEGSVAEGSFAAYYCKGQDVVAVGTLKKDPRAAQFANLLKSGRKLAKNQINEEWYLDS